MTLLHVIEWLAEEEPRTSAHFNVPEYRRHMVDAAQERLRTLAADETRAWVDVDDPVVFGRAYREILRMAESKPADLIVMGAQGRGDRPDAVWIDNAAGRPCATCPVLTVRGLPAI